MGDEMAITSNIYSAFCWFRLEQMNNSFYWSWLQSKLIKYNFVDLSVTLPMRLSDICQNTEDNEMKIPSRKVSENSCRILQKEHNSEEFNDDNVDENNQQTRYDLVTSNA